MDDARVGPFGGAGPFASGWRRPLIFLCLFGACGGAVRGLFDLAFSGFAEHVGAWVIFHGALRGAIGMTFGTWFCAWLTRREESFFFGGVLAVAVGLPGPVSSGPGWSPWLVSGLAGILAGFASGLGGAMCLQCVPGLAAKAKKVRDPLDDGL